MMFHEQYLYSVDIEYFNFANLGSNQDGLCPWLKGKMKNINIVMLLVGNRWRSEVEEEYALKLNTSYMEQKCY